MNTIENDIEALGMNGAASHALRLGDLANQHLSNLEALPPRRKFEVGRFVRRLFVAGVAGTAATTAGLLAYPSMDFRRPGSVAHYWVHRKRRRKPISVAEAHAIALHAMQETDRLLHEERMTEAALLAQLFEDEDFVTG